MLLIGGAEVGRYSDWWVSCIVDFDFNKVSYIGHALIWPGAVDDDETVDWKHLAVGYFYPNGLPGQQQLKVLYKDHLVCFDGC